MIAKILKRGAFGLFNGYYRRQFNRFCIAAGKCKLFIIDIDNTIADTMQWEREHPGKRIKVAELLPLLSMKQWLEEETAGGKIVYLSARNYWQKGKTKQWLQQHGFMREDELLVLVPSAKDKIAYLEEAVKRKTEVVYVDDLSYLRPNGQQGFYEDLIRQVKKLPLTYLDYQFISSRSTSHA